MRISDWSSDVCSSDLAGEHASGGHQPQSKRALALGEGRGGRKCPHDSTVSARLIYCSRCACPLRPPLIRRVSAVQSRASHSALSLRRRQNHSATSTAPSGFSASSGWLTRSRPKIGRASCRERVCQYVLISVVTVSLKKKTKQKKK